MLEHFLLLVSRSLLSFWVAVVIFTLAQSVMFGFLEGSSPWRSAFCVVCDVFLLWDHQKKGQGLSKLCSVLINVVRVRPEVSAFSSVNLTVITSYHWRTAIIKHLNSSFLISWILLQTCLITTRSHQHTASLQNLQNQSACLPIFPESWQS